MSTYDDASLIYYPSGYKEDKIYSLKPTDGSGDLDFTRASTATRVNEQGLIEGVRTNLLTYSQNFTATGGWSGSTITTTANYGTSPDGTTTSTRLVFGSANQFWGKSISGLSGNLAVFSLYIKGTAGQTIQINDGFVDKKITLSSGWNRVSSNGNVTTSGVVNINTFKSASALDIEVWGGQVEFSPSATEYIPTTTTAVSVGITANIPRIDYTGGGCGKLLLEPQRTNLVLQSQEISVSPWSKGTGTILSNVEVSPDGTSNADKYVYGGSGASVLQQTFTVASGSTYTASVWLKGDSNGNVIIGNGAGSVYQVKSVTTEWQRFEYQRTTTSTSESFAIFLSGSTLSSVYVWNVQYELGSYSTSLINTTTTAVTRVADSASKSGISSLINSTEGVLYAEIPPITANTNNHYVTLNDGTLNNKINIRFDYGGSKVVFFYTLGGVSQGLQSLSDWDFTITNKLAFLYQNSNFKSYRNGVQIGSNASGSTAIANTLNTISFDVGNGSQNFYGKVQNLMIFPSALSDTDLAALTTL